jgi:cytidine deaminase
MNQDQLIEAAVKVTQQSYSPYSHKKVGAALRCNGGQVFTGCNVENASFGATICAERSAVVCAISTIGPGLQIEAIAVATPSDTPWAPCGMCLQVLAEFADGDTPVFLIGENGKKDPTTLAELLPRAFSKKEMDR